MLPSIEVARAALAEAGHGDIIDRLVEDPIYGVSIKSPCEKPHTAIKAVAIAHQAAGHLVVCDFTEDGHGNFSCFECGLD